MPDASTMQAPTWVALAMLVGACVGVPDHDGTGGPCIQATTETNGPWNSEWSGNEIERLITDASGNALLHEIGTTEAGYVVHELWLYNANGDPESFWEYWVDLDPNYKTAVTTYTYDDDRHLILVDLFEQDFTSQLPDLRFTYTWAGDRIVSETQENDGELWYTGTRTYDGEGQLLRRLLHYPSGGNDITWDYTWEGGSMRSESYDNSPLPGANSTTWWTWDTAGHETLKEMDGGSYARTIGEGADGSIDYRFISVWDGDDRVQLDAEDWTGKLDARTTWEYDELHRPIRMVVDPNYGSARRVSETTWESVACPFTPGWIP